MATVLGLMAVVLACSVVQPVQLVMVPLALLLIGLPPRNAVTIATGAVLLALVLIWPRHTLWSVERGWALLASGWFLVLVVGWPRAPFTTRALGATGAAMGTAALIIALLGGWSELDWTMANHFREAAAAAGRAWSGTPLDAEQVATFAAEIPARLFPALLGIGTVAALGVAWWMYWRLAGWGQPLGRLTEFRFPDPLVWVLIGGIALLVLPLAEWASRVGGNVVLFMSALYALRGLAVLVALVLGMVGGQLFVLLLLALVGVILYPIVAAGTLLLGVTDTWLDLRAPRRALNDRG